MITEQITLTKPKDKIDHTIPPMVKDFGFRVLYHCSNVIQPYEVVVTKDKIRWDDDRKTTLTEKRDDKCNNLQAHPGRCSRCGSTSSIGVWDPIREDNTRRDTKNRKRVPAAHQSKEKTPSTTKE